MILAQATWATLVGIPFFVSLHVNATCEGRRGEVCDAYEDLSPGVQDGDGFEHYFEPAGGIPTAQLNVSEADVIELSEFGAAQVAFGYVWVDGGAVVPRPLIQPYEITRSQPLSFGPDVYTRVWDRAIEDREWAIPRVAAWLRIQPSLQRRLDEQWNNYVLTAGAAPGDTRPRVVLGVHVRGTDTNTGAPLQSFFQLIDQFISAYEACGGAPGSLCSRVVILLATEDVGHLNNTIARYGSRVATQNGGHIVRSEGGEGVWSRAGSNALRLGEEVVIDTLLLSRSDYLLRPHSAVSEWAIYYNPALVNNSWTVGNTFSNTFADMGVPANPPRPFWMGYDPDADNATRGCDADPISCERRCPALALELSIAYRATDRFVGSTAAELSQYLSSHGVLFTMCEKYDDCSARSRPVAHWSGSWVNNRTGFRFFDADPEGRPMGLIIDPMHLTIRCMYPSDGHTHQRDDNGCGAYEVDPVSGSRGAAQLSESDRAIAVSMLDQQMGNRTANEISCVQWYHLDVPGTSPNVTGWHPPSGDVAACEQMKLDGKFVYEGATAAWERMAEAIAGHPVCTPNEEAVHALAGQFWVYTGSCSWAPTEWQSMVDFFVNQLMPASADVPPLAERRRLWNEIVAQPPANEQEEIAATKAMFYVVGSNRTENEELHELAHRNAATLGNVPVLRIDWDRLARGGPLFECAATPLP